MSFRRCPAIGAAVLAAALLATAPAQAGVVSVSQSDRGYQNWMSTLHLAKFDSQLGQLREVRVAFSFDAEHQALVRNPTTRPINAIIEFLSEFQVSGPGTVGASADMTRSVSLPLSVSDDWTALTERQSSKSTSTVRDRLDDFIGSGSWDLWVRSDNGVASSFWTSDFATVLSMTQASLQVKVDYLYDDAPAPQPQPVPRPLPEPMTPALAGLALLAVALQRRAARRA